MKSPKKLSHPATVEARDAIMADLMGVVARIKDLERTGSLIGDEPARLQKLRTTIVLAIADAAMP